MKAAGAMRWLVTGAGGMLGQDVVAALAGQQVTAADRQQLDVTDLQAVLDAVNGHDVVVNCAAWTAVDDAESQEPQAFAVNAVGAGHLARACAATGARLVHVSTDYVFEGRAPSPAIPYPEDAPLRPVNAYGRTKAAGEWAVRSYLPGRHWVVRTAWLYGAGGPSFIRTVASLESRQQLVRAVDDQHGQPTWSRDVADRIVAMVTGEVPPGTYHATSSGQATWYELARAVFTMREAEPQRVHPVASSEFLRPAVRPSWSVLGHDAWARVGLGPLRPWREALHEAIVDHRILDDRDGEAAADRATAQVGSRRA